MSGNNYKPAVREAFDWRDKPMWRWWIWAAWWAAFLALLDGDEIAALTGIEPGKIVTAFGTAGSLLLLAAGTMTICQTLLARLNGHRRTS